MHRSIQASLLLAAALAPAEVAQAQWSMFHGDAQRSGYVDVVGPQTANPKWSVAIGGPIISSPILGSDGTIYLGSVLEDTLRPNHYIVAVHPDGTIKWRFRTGFVDTQTLSSPAVGPDGTVYVGAQDGVFYALRPNGTQRWSFRGEQPVRQHPVVAPDGTVYVSIDGRLTAFDPAGTLLWRSAETDLTFPGGPSLAADGTIYAAGGTPGVEAKLYAFRPDGTQAWLHSFGNKFFFPGAPPSVGPDGTIFTYTHALYAFRPDGTVRWIRELSFGDSHYGSAAVDDQGFVYYAGSGAIWKVDPSGAIVWEHELVVNQNVGSSWSSPLVDADGNVFVGLGTGNRWERKFERRLLVLRPNGNERWHFDLPRIPSTSAPALAPDGTLYIGCLDGKLYAFD